jgi:phenylpropionate dioxygenase-like ring-hydroxylating dioxygenase large terminal subunit
VRDREGKIRAFANVCRHRGGPFAPRIAVRNSE